jgi:hypothetical protein
MPLGTTDNTDRNSAAVNFPFLLGDHLIRDLVDLSGRACYWGNDGSINNDQPGGTNNLDPADPDDATKVNSYWRVFDGRGDGGFAADISGAVSSLFLHCDLELTTGTAEADTGVIFYDVGSYADSFTILIQMREQGSLVYEPIASFEVAANQPRRGAVWMPFVNLYDTIGGVRIEFQSGTLDWNDGTEPQVLEAFIGKRVQLDHGLLRPFDPLATTSEIEEFISDGGQFQRVVLHRFRHESVIRFLTQPGNGLFQFDVKAQMELFRSRTLDLTRSWIFCPRPYLGGNINRFEVYLGIQSTGAGLTIPETGRDSYEIEIPFREMPPFFVTRT